MNLKLLNAVKYLAPQSALEISSMLLSGENGYEKDVETAIEILKSFAYKGDSECQYMLYCILDDDGYIEEAIHWLQKAVEQGHPRALAMAYSEYYDGNIAWLDEERAIECLVSAAEVELPLAIGMVGSMYLYGNNYIEKNEVLAMRYYNKAADKGDAISLYYMYLLNKDAKRDLRLSWLRESAERGYSKAKYELWKELSNEAFFWLEESVAMNEIDAHYDYAKLQENGVFTKENLRSSIDTYCNLAKMNHTLSADRLNYHLVFNENTEEYLQFMNELVENKAFDSLSLMALGQIVDGNNISKNYKYITMAAKEESNIALYHLANLMMYGDEIEGCMYIKNENKAIENYYKAARLGNIDAMEKIAFEYIRGNTINIANREEIVEFLEEASNENNGKATNLLGKLYYNGTIVEQDYDKSRRYFQLAAKQGESTGWYNLMQYCMNEEDYETASVCFLNALDEENYFAMVYALENSDSLNSLLKGYDLNYINEQVNSFEELVSFSRDIYCDINRVI